MSFYYQFIATVGGKEGALTQLEDANYVTLEQVQGEGQALEAQLWQPILLANVGNDACILVNRLSGRRAHMKSRGILDLGLATSSDSKQIDIQEFPVFFLKSTAANKGDIMPITLMGISAPVQCIIGYKVPMGGLAFVAASGGNSVNILPGVKDFTIEALDEFRTKLPGDYTGLWSVKGFFLTKTRQK
jgi:hypothetical protein